VPDAPHQRALKLLKLVEQYRAPLLTQPRPSLETAYNSVSEQPIFVKEKRKGKGLQLLSAQPSIQHVIS
jgi:hypothetical protein